MISSLRIRSLALIDEAELEFSPGFTAITGETGAGKTMLLNALRLLMGEKGDNSQVRQGSRECIVEGTCLASEKGKAALLVEQAGGYVEENGFEIGRIFPREGRSKAQAGGRSVPLGVLAEIGKEMVAIHGQSDQVRLRSAAAQLSALDSYGGDDYGDLLKSYMHSYEELKEANSKLEEWNSQLTQRREHREFLEVAVEILNNIAPRKNEYTELCEQATKLGAVEMLREKLDLAYQLLTGDESLGAQAQIAQAGDCVAQAAAKDPKLGDVAKGIQEASYLIEDYRSELSSYLMDLQADPEELERIEQRRSDISQAARRFGVEPDSLAEYWESIQKELGPFNDLAAETEALEEDAKKALAKAEELANQLSSARQKAAAQLSRDITKELGFLAMGSAKIEIKVSPRDSLNQNGKDEVSFWLQSHSKAPQVEISQGASGGELSRVMLAIEVSLARKEKSGDKQTFIFDEIDAGIGGEAGIEVGKRLAKLSQTHQVIVVTHLPQVAAFGDRHIQVSRDKKTGDTAFTTLDDKARRVELARMLAGQMESEFALRHADELIALGSQEIP